jgi:aryl-alcohol dehydrogenase-like predicted oxidoreductase
MRTRRLGGSGLVVSEIGLGTMTFGEQTAEADAFRILDRSFDRGVTFLDTAELYPVPPSAPKAGDTEVIVGKWLQGKPRHQVLVASKIAGPGHGWFKPPVRDGITALDRHQIRIAVEGSLRRLRTDYLDLYQVHWPDHGARYGDTLAALTELMEEGKIRAIGTSNETCWGLMKSLWEAERHGTARFDTVQNNFSLINRRCESELAQVCRRENVSLLPYSPLGGGVLTGKYNGGALPAGARFSSYLESGGERQKRMAARFVNDRTLETTRRLGEIALAAGLPLPTLAVAWSKQHDFVASTLIGVSAYEQLDACLDAADVVLDEETMAAIDRIDAEIPNPMTEDGLRRL